MSTSTHPNGDTNGTTTHTVERLSYNYLRDCTATQITDYVKGLEEYAETLDEVPTVVRELIFTLHLMFEAKIALAQRPGTNDPAEDEQSILDAHNHCAARQRQLAIRGILTGLVYPELSQAERQDVSAKLQTYLDEIGWPVYG